MQPERCKSHRQEVTAQLLERVHNRAKRSSRYIALGLVPYKNSPWHFPSFRHPYGGDYTHGIPFGILWAQHWTSYGFLWDTPRYKHPRKGRKTWKIPRFLTVSHWLPWDPIRHFVRDWANFFPNSRKLFEIVKAQLASNGLRLQIAPRFRIKKFWQNPGLLYSN